MRRFVILVSIFAGCGDFVTGMLLLISPQQAPAMMRVPAVQDLVWVRFVGVFVGCVGLSYFYGLAFWKLSHSPAKLQITWELTAVFRLAAGLFVLVQITKGHLDHAWLSVPGSDFFWAFVQLLVLRKGFPKND